MEVAEVWRLLDERVKPLESERIPLRDALGRVLAAEVKADADQPPFDRSAMDGYAFFPAAGPAKYRVAGTIKAGEVAGCALNPGEAMRIFTGAALPALNMAVLMQEEARVEGEWLLVDRRVEPGENVRRQGSDAQVGDVLLGAGKWLNPIALAVLASVGEVQPLVKGAPRIAHATTGDEIVPPESKPRPGQIRNSNQILIASLLKQAGVPSANIHQEHWGDDPARAAACLAAEPFASADMVLISGGASVGDHDYAARVLEEAGYELLVRKINSRPGRPLLVGFRGRQIAFGLPGNPVSHFACFHLFVRHALTCLKDEAPPKWAAMKLTESLPQAANRRPTYWPANFKFQKGGPTLRALEWHNSGHLAALTQANAIIHVPANTLELPAGALVDTLLTFPVFK